MKKVLIANRGEIALRIMRSCHEMGIKTVAVFSEVDRDAPFVRYADEAVCIGPAPSNQSYLVMNNILDVARKLDVEGIHPGYGFLSENSEFAKKIEEAGITFIGPDTHAIEVMGNKLAAKAAVKAFGIPMVPGTEGAIDNLAEAKKVAEEIGFPVLIKAAAGGGGKGMRTVHEAESVEEQLKLAMNEAISAFGDGSVFIERYVTTPRHIEFQILADKHGNVVHLFDRECSIQRRHQKVIEEAPSSVLTPELRHEMGECAKKVALSCNYVGAGTVEFILENNTDYYFLEMNTRLQVEHPVTEQITGIDLVKEQIKVARGEKLSFSQEDIKIIGHSLEVRVYAEDPQNNFLPDIGTLHRYRKPEGPGIRVDDGFEEGMQIPIYYDPMISKLITSGENRQEAIERMVRAIDDYKIEGVSTTGNFDTHFVEKYFKPEILDHFDQKEEELAALVIGKLFDESNSNKSHGYPAQEVTNWKYNRN